MSVELVMILLVRDGADIVRENLDFHFSQGVSFAIVTDHRSRDGTVEILREYERRGTVRVIRQRGTYDQAAWMSEMAELAVAEHGAEWVLPNDVDEFWLPEEGSLAARLGSVPERVGALVCPRINFVPTPEDGRPWWERMTLRERVPVNAVGRKPPPPKLIHRGYPGLRIKKGNHRRLPPELGVTESGEGIEVLHFQMRTYAQFERGVRHMARALRQIDDPARQPGRPRQRHRRHLRRGELPAYYAERVAVGPDKQVAEDVRLRDHLKSLYGSQPPVPPARTRARKRSAARLRVPRPRRRVAPAPFVVGVPRSGTTLLRLMLDAHPKIAIPAETHFVPSVIERWRELEPRATPAERVEACLELIIRHPRWPDLDLEPEELRAHLGSIRRPRAADVARAIHVLHAQARGKRRWGDKTPGYLRHMRLIRRTLPEARFVHVIRDGRDVALSLAQVSWGTDDVANAAARWKRLIRGTRRRARRLPPNAYIEVRFEELLADPERELRRVCGELDLAFDEAMLSYHLTASERLRPTVREFPTANGAVMTPAERAAQHELVSEPPRLDRAGRWREEMPADSRREFEGVAGELLEELGYPLSG